MSIVLNNEVEMLKRIFYEKYIEDVALEISQSREWRLLLKNSEYNKQFLISKDSIIPLPSYIKEMVEQNGLKFYVSKVNECDEDFDEDLIIFKFETLEFKAIISTHMP